MDLTIESALSTGGMVGHLAYLLLVISMMMRTMLWLRLFAIASAVVAIAYASIWLRDPVSLFWETMLVTVNVVQIAILWRSDRMARFSEEEKFFVSTRLRGLSPGQARKLIDTGIWRDAPAGEVLTEEGQPPAQLSFIVSGQVGIYANDSRIAECGAGAFVGEMSLVDEGKASATARVEGGARLWQIPIPKLAQLRESKPEQTAALDAAIARDIRAKLVAANHAHA